MTARRAVPTVGVLALQGDVREHLAMLERAGAVAVPVRRPVDLDAIDGIVLPGGESTTMHKLARIFDLFDPLRSALATGLPAFGTCAGMILLADRIENPVSGQETLGGLDIVVRRNAFGSQVNSFEATVDVRADPGFRFPATFIRSPGVVEVGPEVQVVATHSSPDAVGRIVAVRQGGLLATSFHPEITGDHRMHELFVEMVRSRVSGC